MGGGAFVLPVERVDAAAAVFPVTLEVAVLDATFWARVAARSFVTDLALASAHPV